MAVDGITTAGFPRISIVIPTYNEEENIERCLKAIFEQDYPADRLEVLVVDGGSTDRTVELAQQYPIIYVRNPKKLAEAAKILGFSRATGELFLYLDADLFLASKAWLSRLVKPLVEDATIIGAFTRFIPEKMDPGINRYLSYHEFHLDPLLEFICYPLAKTFREDRKDYQVCWFEVGKIPPVGICIYRRLPLRELVNPTEDLVWEDIGMPVILARAGYHRFAYIEDAGMYHLTVKSVRELIRQKRRDVTQIFLPVVDKRLVTYIDFNRPVDTIKLAGWVIYANLIIPTIFKSIWKTLKYRDLACLYEIIVTPLVTDYVVLLFLTNPNGQRLLRRLANRLLGRR